MKALAPHLLENARHELVRLMGAIVRQDTLKPTDFYILSGDCLHLEVKLDGHLFAADVEIKQPIYLGRV